MRSYEARSSTVPPKLELWRGQSSQLSTSQNFGGDSPSLSPMIYATEWHSTAVHTFRPNSYTNSQSADGNVVYGAIYILQIIIQA